MATPRLLLLLLQLLVAMMITIVGTATPSRVVVRDNTDTVCPDDWLHYDSLCVKFFDEEKVPWWKAWSYCRNHTENTHLAYVESQREHDRLTGMMAMAEIDEVWIGLNDLSVEGNFQWADGESVNYTNYAPNTMINAESNEDCVDIRKNTTYKWSLDYCFVHKHYVCRKDVS
ncbi:snaclec botrocetin subunit beta-like [Panulirus ornatus]|uniref:snaclec botrocetin subunit beta-like n=1 Tax=Panulirus ornatus TaxID=150431 RepID=UPI003A8A8EC3